MSKRFALVILALLLFSFSYSQGFIENQGQWLETFSFKKDIAGGSAYLEKDGILFHLVDRSGLYGAHYESDRAVADNISHHHVFKLRFLGCSPDFTFSTKEPYTNYVNYFLGDKSRWRSQIYPSKVVEYQEIYPDIDLRVIEHGDNLKYEFEVKPAADYRDIRIKIEDASEVKLTRNGDIQIGTTVADILDTKPKVYQKRGKKQWEVESEFVLTGNTVSYSIGAHDTTLPLIIDPELIFSTFSGSSSDNWGYTATPGPDGSLYAGSASTGDGYPTTSGAYDIDHNGPAGTLPSDITISRFSADGSSLIYSTYLGGDNTDLPHSMVVNERGHLFVFGTTGSDNFPTTDGAADDSYAGGGVLTNLSFTIGFPSGVDMYVSRFNASGTSLLGSTFLGGSGIDGINNATSLSYNYADEARGEIILDNDGDVIVVSSTRSDDFPGRGRGFQSSISGNQDGIIVKLNDDLTSIVWSSYLGGGDNDACYGVAVTENNELYVCGGTESLNFPTHSTAFQDDIGGGQSDGFITHISENGRNMLHSTYFGSSAYDQMFLIQLDNNNHPHVFGQTENTGNHFILGAAFNDVGGGQVLAHFRKDLESRVWSTQFGSTSGRPNISPTSFLVDVCNSVYIAGWGGATQQFGNNNASDVGGLPVTGGPLKSTPDEVEAEFYLAILDADANTQTYGTFFGGDQTSEQNGEHVDGGTSRFDRGGVVYQAVCAGCGGGDDFPIEPDPGAWSATNGSANCNLGVFKLDMELPLILADFSIPDFGCAPFTVTANNNSLIQNATSYSWDFGNGQTSTANNPTTTYNQAGNYTVRLIVSDPNSCNLRDTLIKEIKVKKDTSYTIDTLNSCVADPILIGPNAADFEDLDEASISWIPGGSLNNSGIINPTATLNSTTTFVLRIDYGGCIERVTQTVQIDRFDINLPNDTIVCSSFTPFNISAKAIGVSAVYEWSFEPEFQNIISTDSTILVDGLTDPVTKYYVRATKPNGCDIIDTFQVTVSDYDLRLTNDTAICQDAGASIEAVSENPLNTFIYYWTLEPYTGSEELLTDSTSRILPIGQNEPTTYHLFARSTAVAEECTVRDSTRVQVSVLSKASVRATAEKYTFYFGEEIQLTGTPSDGFFHYWTPGTFLNDSTLGDPIAKPKMAMEYTYIVTDRDLPECSFSDTVAIAPYEILCGEPEIFLPSAFTPNGDGLNEVLFLRGKNIKSMEMAIYDRWGKLMFESTDQSSGWDGTFDGTPVEPGVFVYYFEARCIDEQRIFRKGNVTLVHN